MPKVVVTDYTFDALDVETAILQPLGYEIVAWKEKRPPAELAKLVADADAVITQFAPVNAEVIAAMTRARVIVRYGIGVDNVDLEAARRQGHPRLQRPRLLHRRGRRPDARLHPRPHATGRPAHAGPPGGRLAAGRPARGDEGAARPHRRRRRLRPDRTRSPPAGCCRSGAGCWCSTRRSTRPIIEARGAAPVDARRSSRRERHRHAALPVQHAADAADDQPRHASAA